MADARLDALPEDPVGPATTAAGGSRILYIRRAAIRSRVTSTGVGAGKAVKGD